MIRMKLMGRLGNQLFIYSLAREIVQKYNTTVLIYDRNKEKDPKWHSRLEHYNLDPRIKFTSKKLKLYCMNPFRFAIYAFNRYKIKSMTPRARHEFQLKHMQSLEKMGFFLLEDGYKELPKSINRNMFFEGFFQSEKYFSDVRKNLLKELVPKHKFSNDEYNFMKKIESCNSVCVTIRLGDYLKNPTHQVCSIEFYKKAIQKMKDRFPNAKFFVFSDDIRLVKEKFQFDDNVEYDTGKMEDYASLYIMSKCKHFIISNSSFSWWAQYLSTNNQKVVIAPSRWYGIDVPCDIYQKNWITLD